MARFCTAIRKFLRENDAPTSVEYALMIAFIAAVVIGGATVLGQSTSGIFTAVGNTIAGLAGGG